MNKDNDMQMLEPGSFGNNGLVGVNHNNNTHISDKSNNVYLVETFYINTKKNTIFEVKLTNRGLILKKENNSATKEQTILLKDIIGCRCLRSKRKSSSGPSCACSSLPRNSNSLKVVEENSEDQDESDVSAYLYIYAYIIKHSRRSGHRERTSITLRFRSFDKYEDNNREAQKWRAAIKYLINGDSQIKSVYVPTENRKMLILINPKSGSGKAREIFQQRVSSIFAEAEIVYELHVTKKANFAREFVRTRDIYSYRGIVCVGGDGIFFEVINGIFEREDWQAVIQDVKIGIIPCGSGNGLAKTISHLYDEPFDSKPFLGAALAAVRGKTELMDLVRVENRSQIMFSFLSVGWGLISDIDIESERLRLIGGQRFTVWSLHRLISLRTYHGTVSYIPATKQQLQQQQQRSSGTGVSSGSVEDGHRTQERTKLKHSMSYNTTINCMECNDGGECEACDIDFGDVLSLDTGNTGNSIRPRLDSWYSANSRKSAYYSTADSVYQSVGEKMSQFNQNDSTYRTARMFGPSSNIPALTTPVPDHWIKLTGEFIMVHAAYQTHLGSDCYFATSSKLDDGIIWLCIIHSGCSRSQLFSFLLGLSHGTHIPSESDLIQMIPVTAFRIEPTGEQGHLTVDGESVEYGPIQGEIFQGMTKVMVPDYT